MVTCEKCTSHACLSQVVNNRERHFCVVHFNLEGSQDVLVHPVNVIDDEVLAVQTIEFQDIARKAIADVAMKMYAVQKKEENENRLRSSKPKAREHLPPSGIVDNKSKISKGSLWSTNISQLDKEKILKEIDESEREENTLKNTENKLGVTCISCGSRSTLARNRYALETCKNEVWGNKDNDSGLVTIECQDCGYVGDNL